LLTLIKLIANLTKKKMEQRQAQEQAAPMPRRRRPAEAVHQPVQAAPVIQVPVTQNISMLYKQGHSEFMAGMAAINANEERRMRTGNFIYPFVQEILFNQMHLAQNQMLAGKVTGMIISLQEPDLSYSTSSFEALHAKVREAINLIQTSGLSLV